MRKTIVSFVLGLALSGLLYFGQGAMHDFAFYVMVVFNVFAWLGVLTGVIRDEIAARIRRTVWLQGAGTAVQLWAVVETGHPVLAASSFIVSFLIVCTAFGDKKEAAKP